MEILYHSKEATEQRIAADTISGQRNHAIIYRSRSLSHCIDSAHIALLDNLTNALSEPFVRIA